MFKFEINEVVRYVKTNEELVIVNRLKDRLNNTYFCKDKNDKIDLIYRVSVLNIHEVEEFLKLGYILLVKKRIDVNTETSYNFNQKPYIVKEYCFGVKI